MLKKFFAPVDMTEGSPWKKIVFFTLPMLLGNIAQQLYNTVDSVVVGNYVGDNALAAVGSAGPILNLLLVLFVGISVGAGIIVSQYFGAKEREKLSQTIGTTITATFARPVPRPGTSRESPRASSGSASTRTWSFWTRRNPSSTGASPIY